MNPQAFNFLMYVVTPVSIVVFMLHQIVVKEWPSRGVTLIVLVASFTPFINLVPAFMGLLFLGWEVYYRYLSDWLSKPIKPELKDWESEVRNRSRNWK